VQACQHGQLSPKLRLPSLWNAIDALVSVMFIMAVVLRVNPSYTNGNTRCVKVVDA
jgi:hypothetical protein